MLKLITLFAMLHTAMISLGQQTQADIIYKENAANDARRLQKQKDEASKPNLPSNNGSGLSKEYWIERQTNIDDARKSYKALEDKIRQQSKYDTRPVYTIRENIKGKTKDYVEIESPKGWTYKGGYRNFKFQGMGGYTSVGVSIYLGNFVNDKFHGKGKYYNFKTNVIYEGDFKKDKMSGEGIWRQNEIAYIGSFKNDLKNGLGIQSDTVGNTWEGYWKKGFMNGNIVHKKNGKLVYEGEYEDDKKEGKGTESLKDGSTYFGSYKNNLFHKKGRLLYASGNTYEGSFKEGLFDGKGTMTYKDGRVEKGTWRAGIFLK